MTEIAILEEIVDDGLLIGFLLRSLENRRNLGKIDSIINEKEGKVSLFYVNDVSVLLARESISVKKWQVGMHNFAIDCFSKQLGSRKKIKDNTRFSQEYLNRIYY